MMSNHRQFTIRELMLLVLFAGAGLSGLLTGGVLASIVLGVAIIITTGFGIVAFVARDELRALAIGFLIPIVVYAATIVSVGSSELDPTAKLLRPAHRFIVKTEWVNLMTGELVPNYDPTRGGGGGFAGAPIGGRETPDRTTFMSLAHVLLATMFGYAGAKFALYVHRRQAADRETGDEQDVGPASRLRSSKMVD